MAKIITRSGAPVQATKKRAVAVSNLRLDEIKQYIADIKKIIQATTPVAEPNPTLDGTVKFGIVDTFLIKKQKPDQNGFYSNTRLITHQFADLKEAITHMVSNNLYDSNKSLIMYKTVSNKWNFQLLKILPNLKNKENAEKYLLLL